MKNLNEEKFAHITVFEKNLEFQIDTLEKLNKLLKTLKKVFKRVSKAYGLLLRQAKKR